MYESGAGTLAMAGGELTDNADLEHLAQELPEQADLLESDDEAPIIGKLWIPADVEEDVIRILNLDEVLLEFVELPLSRQVDVDAVEVPVTDAA